MSATTSVTVNFYEILGIKKDATPEEVRKAYRRRALQTHPDRLPQGVSPADKKAAEEQFRLVNNAYEVLNNEESRKLYDKHGVWPPPAERPDYGRTSSRDAHMSDPFSNDPFFSTPFGFGSRSRGSPFGFTDPFELFNSLFGDLHRAFESDPFFAGTPFSRSPFDDPFFRSPFDNDPFFRSSPFGGSMLGGLLSGGRSPFGALMGGGSMFPQIEGGSSRMYSSRTEAVGRNGQWVSRSQMTRTVNGRTEVITKCIDADGNEHVTYSSPDGERYTINGIEQPSHANRPIEGPRRSETAPPQRQPPQAIADAPTQPASYYIPQQQQQQQQSYSIPISTGPHHQVHPQAAPANAYVDRSHSRASRHSTHRDEDARSARRSYTSRKSSASSRPAGDSRHGGPGHARTDSASSTSPPRRTPSGHGHADAAPGASPAERMYGGHDPSVTAATPMASNYGYAPNGNANGYAQSRDPRRDSVHSGHSHHSAGKSSHHGHGSGHRLSRHESRDHHHRDRERERSMSAQEQPHGAGHSHAQRGWRGWLSTILHPFKHHKHQHTHETIAQQVPVH
ncbi:DnaJ-domain-containing protein [Trametes cingulata]|nr:DnaJ-domain-containing protein [Trametes cingulata]